MAKRWRNQGGGAVQPPRSLGHTVRFVAYLGASNDANGNPRRGWALYGGGGLFLGFADEGYAGLPVALRGFAGVTGRIEITPREYRGMLAAQRKLGGTLDTYRGAPCVVLPFVV